MKYLAVKHACVLILAAIVFPVQTRAEVQALASGIEAVKLYQNQAMITRRTTAGLKKGENIIVLGGLPRTLHDWSVKGSLPKNFAGKILSMEVEQKALLNKKQQRILEIEKKLETLREQDVEHLDGLKNIQSQLGFLDSVVSFTNQTASRELATRIPQIKVWDETLRYVSEKRRDLMAQKRGIEKKREELGKQIQQWEFELSQIAGHGYFMNYQALNKAMLGNRSSMAVQQFADINEQYATQRKLFVEPSAGRVDIEKRVIAHVFSEREQSTTFSFSYLIPDTSWQMLYDVRASSEKRDITMVVFANIRQRTGEDWSGVRLALSTGMPVHAIQPLAARPWFLDVPRGRYAAEGLPRDEEMSVMKREKAKISMSASGKKADLLTDAEVEEKGPYFEIGIPMEQTILSSSKYQRKYIKEFSFGESSGIRFYYELVPEEVGTAFLKVRLANSTTLPWLSGEAQIFLENEFMGRSNIPFTPVGKSEELTLGTDSRISSKKELVKKFEDTSGLFGGKRRILYSYKITVENQLPKEAELMVVDAFPVSLNQGISAEVQNLSLPFHRDEDFEKTTEYARGIRKWRVALPAHQKREISYEVVISFDKEINPRGMR